MSPVNDLVIVGPELTGNYPHFGRRDAVLWERFLALRGETFTGFAYDVALGGVVIEDPTAEPDFVRAYQYLNAVKIDVVGFRSDEVWVIEVKPNAGLSAVGQALGGLVLAQRDGFTRLPLVPVIVTDHLTDDLRFVAERLAIQIIVVPDPVPGVTP